MSLITSAFSAAGSAVADLGKFSIDVGKNFESSMAQVIATMGITKNTVEDGVNSYDLLKKAAADAGESTTFSASEAADALNYLALAGYSAAQSADALPQVLNLASAGGLKLADASDLATDAMAALGIAANGENLKKFGDEMAKTASKSNTSVAQLGEAILTVGGTAKELAGGTVELNTALGVLANVGIKGSEGGTALRNIMLAMTPTTDKAAAAFERLNLESYDANGNLRPLNETFKDLNKAISGMTSQEKTEVLNNIFNKVDLKSASAMLAACASSTEELGNAFLYAGVPAENLETFLENFNSGAYKTMSETEFLSSIMNDFGVSTDSAGAIYSAFVTQMNGVSFENLYNEISSCDGAMEDMAHTMNDTLEGDLKSIGSKAEAFGIAVYDNINQPLRDIVTLGGEYVAKLTNALKDSGFEGLAETFGDVLADAVNVVSGYIPKILNVAVSVIKSFAGGIAKNSGSIAKTFSQVGTAVLSGISEIIPEFFNAGADILYNLLDGFSEVLPELIDTAVSGVSKLAAALSNGSSKLWEISAKLISGIANEISNKILELSAAASDIIKSFSETINKNFPEIFSAGIQIVEILLTAVLENLPVFAESAISIIRMLCDTLLTSENLEKLFSAGYEILTAITGIIIDSLPELIDIAVQIIDFLCTELLSSDNISNLINTAVGILTALADAVVDNIDEILLAAEQIITTICNELLKPENLEKIIKTGAELLGKLIVGLCEIGGKLLGFAGLMFKEIGSTLRDIDWGSIGIEIVEGICSGMLDCDFVLKDYLSDFGDNWLTGIKDIFDIHSPSKLMKDEVGKYLALGVGEGFGENADQIGQQILNAVSEWASILPQKSQESANKFSENTVSVFGDFPSEIAKYLESSLNIAQKWGIGISDSGKNTAENFVDSIRSYLKKLPEISLKILNETSERFTAWETNLINYGGKTASELVSKVINGVSCLPSRMNEIGRNLAEGLWNGVSGAGGWLRRRIYEFGNEITANFRTVFGIHSPSAVMRDSVGKYLAQGIGVGFEDEFPDIAGTTLKAFEDIKISTPEIDFSRIDTPDLSLDIAEITAPDIDFSGLEIPEIKNPKLLFDVPKIDIPELEIIAPNVEFPTIETPDLRLDIAEIESPEIPETESPELLFDIPKIDIPELEINAPEIKISDVPQIESPEISFDVPEINAPKFEITAPNIELSDLEIPEIENPELSFDVPEIDVPELEITAPNIEFSGLEIPEIENPELSLDVPKIEIPDTELEISVAEIELPELELSVPDIEVPELKIQAETLGIGLENTDISAVQTLETQSINLNSGFIQPSATSEIVNNTYYNSSYNSSTTNNTSTNPQNIVLNAQFIVGEEIVAEGVANIIADQIDEHQGVKIQLRKRGLAR